MDKFSFFLFYFEFLMVWWFLMLGIWIKFVFFVFFHLGSKLLSVYRLGRHFQVCIICENLSCVLNCISFFFLWFRFLALTANLYLPRDSLSSLKQLKKVQTRLLFLPTDTYGLTGSTLGLEGTVMYSEGWSAWVIIT